MSDQYRGFHPHIPLPTHNFQNPEPSSEYSSLRYPANQYKQYRNRRTRISDSAQTAKSENPPPYGNEYPRKSYHSNYFHYKKQDGQCHFLPYIWSQCRTFYPFYRNRNYIERRFRQVVFAFWTKFSALQIRCVQQKRHCPHIVSIGHISSGRGRRVRFS